MWLRGFDFVVIEGEGGRKNQRGNRWTWGRAEKGAHEQGASPEEGLPNGCV